MVILYALTGFTDSVFTLPKLRDVEIDGELESVWDSALTFKDFRQQYPTLDGDVPYPTTAKVFYTDKAIYVAFVCEGRKPVLQRGKRGSLSPDEVSFTLDPYDATGKRYYGFFADPFGNRGDVEVNSGMFNSQWDTEWEAAGKITDNGYIVEMRIPFKAFRYRRGNVWGMAFGRGTADGYSFRIPLNRKGIFPDMLKVRLSPPLSWALTLMPYITYRKDSLYNLWIGEYERYERAYGGGDVRLTLEDNFAHLTVKPDFSNVESDPYYINVGRYRYFLQERRPFFTHDMDLFQPNFNAFLPYTMLLYTRNIGMDDYGNELPITFGLKGGLSLFGTNVALLTVRTDSGQMWNALRTNYRGKNIAVGTFLARYTGTYPYPDFNNPGSFIAIRDTNVLADVDVTFNYGYFQGGFVAMHADYYDDLGGWRSGWTRAFGFGYESQEWNVGFSYSEIDSLFYAERITYMPAAGSKYAGFTIHKTFFNLGKLNYLGVGTEFSVTRDAGEPLSKFVSPSLGLSFGRGHSIYLSSDLGDAYSYDPFRDTLVHYFSRDFRLSSYFNVRANYLGMWFSTGNLYNYATGQLGDYSTLNLNLPWRFSEFFRTSDAVRVWLYPGMDPTYSNILRLTFSLGNLATVRTGWEKNVRKGERGLVGLYDRVWVFLSFEKGLTGLYVSFNTKLNPTDTLNINPFKYERADYIFGVKFKGYLRL